MASLVLTLLVVLPIFFYILSVKSRPDARGDHERRRLPLPPSPRGLPLLGHLHLLGPLPHRALRSLAAAHGPVLLLRLGRARTVVVSSAAGAEEVMRTRDLDFASRPRSAMADRLLYGGCDVANAPYGEHWRQARRVCVAHLLSARRVASFRAVRGQEAAALVARVRAHGASVVELGEMLTAYTNTVVSRAAFGDECARGLFEDDDADRGREVRKVMAEFSRLLGTVPMGELLPWLGWVDAVRGLKGRVARNFQALDGLLDKIIDDHRRRRMVPPHHQQDHRHNGGARDFVDVLLDVHEKNGGEYADIRLEMTTDEMKALILDMFAAGTDTISTAMEWAMAELVTHPRAMRRLQDEIRAAVGAESGTIAEDRLEKLPYLKAVTKETLRLHPPVPLLVPREPPADAEVLGHRVPAGTRVVVNAWAIARDPAAWGHDAEEFSPERFLVGGGAADVDYRGQDFRFVPFGAGRRGCPGMGFTEPAMDMALASLLYHFDWQVGTTTPLDMSETNGLSVHIKSGLPLVAKPWTLGSNC